MCPVSNPSQGGTAETGETIRDKLLSLPDIERKFVISNPGVGKHKIIAVRRTEAGSLEYDFEDTPES